MTGSEIAHARHATYLAFRRPRLHPLAAGAHGAARTRDQRNGLSAAGLDAATFTRGHRTLAAALELFRWLRGASSPLIVDLPESVRSNTIHHSESGVMTMDDWLDTYERHIPEHIAQMQRVYDDWEARTSELA